MKHVPLKCALAGAILLLAGCTTRSISNSGFRNHPRSAAEVGGYSGELAELDVIGVAFDAAVTESDIQAALRDQTTTKLGRSSKVLLIQSGADYPDAPMMQAMQEKFAVASFSGRPQPKSNQAADFSRSLRLVAARGGYDKIVCYWGILESERKDKLTATISWVPIVGYVIPDEREHMRLRLKAAIVDVATGRWTFVNPPSSADSRLSAILSREEKDQELVQHLKAEGYQSLVRTLVEHHTE